MFDYAAERQNYQSQFHALYEEMEQTYDDAAEGIKKWLAAATQRMAQAKGTLNRCRAVPLTGQPG